MKQIGLGGGGERVTIVSAAIFVLDWMGLVFIQSFSRRGV